MNCVPKANQPDDRGEWVTGRYLADNGRWFVQLRIGAGRRPTVSADLQVRDGSSLIELSMLARSPDAAPARPGGTQDIESDAPEEAWPQPEREAVFADGRGALSSGKVRVDIVDHGLVDVTFTLGRGLAGLVSGYSVTLRAARVSTALRDVGLEVEYESGVERYFTDELHDAKSALEKVLHQAGLDIHEVGRRTVIDSPPGGAWSASDVFTALNNQLRAAAQSPLTSPVWELHLLLLSKSSRDGLLGMMFDFADDLPRQGAAVFVEAVHDSCPDKKDSPTRILATAVHELGHCLNLTHRFTRDVGRADSLSFMNYDWVYRGGRHADQYWRDRRDPLSEDPGPNAPRRRTFDDDELEFLRHGPRFEVIPGGAPFGSARYWITADGGSADLPVHPDPGLHLWLTPPVTGTRFNYLDPVFLQVSLRNKGGSARRMPRYALDTKAGLLDIVIRRRAAPGRGAASDGDLFVPFMRRCFSVTGSQEIVLQPRESLHNNVNLTFGSAGFPLAEPGEYLITPLLTLFDVDPSVEGRPSLTVVQGPELAITIDPPDTRARERDADLVLRNDVGASFALGGADCLLAATETLQMLVERRDRDDRGGRPDGLRAAAARVVGLNALRHDRGGEAARWLRVATEPTSLATFDPHTAEHTRRMAAKRTAARRTDTAYLDLTVQVTEETRQRKRPVPGVLVSQDVKMSSGRPGSLLVVDATTFAGDPVVRAQAVVSTDEGSTETVTVRQIDVFGAVGDSGRTTSGDGGPGPVAVAYLDRVLTGGGSAAKVDLGVLRSDVGRTADGVRGVLTRAGLEIPSADDDLDAGPLRVVAAAGHAAPWDGNDDGSAPAQEVRSESYIWHKAAWKWCWFLNICHEGPPDPYASGESGPDRPPDA